MSTWLIDPSKSAFHRSHVIAVATIHSAPIKRFLKSLGEERVLNLTYGFPQETIVLFDNGLVAIVSLTVDAFIHQFGGIDET